MLYRDELIKLNRELYHFASRYKENSVDELCLMYEINTKAKNKLNMLTTKLVEVSGLSSAYSDLDEENIVFKTVRLDPGGRLKESMSLPAFLMHLE